jgi:HPt (histidine-containing phosphotransfer) domain-containing protein
MPQDFLPVDWTDFDQLAEDVGPEAMARLLQTFYGEIRTRLAAFAELSVAGSPQGEGGALHREIHSIKSAAGSFGANTLAQFAADIEVAIETGSYRHDGAQLADLATLFSRFQNAVAMRENRNI